MNNFAAQGNSGTDWIFDSGASSHMSASSNWLSSCTKSPFPSIILGDGSSIPIYCVGQAQLPSSTKPLLLRDVLVAPALIKNLISVRQFTCDNLVSAEFDPFGLSVKDYLTKAEIARFNSSGDLYSLNGVPAATPPTSMLASVDLWHRRLGHPNPAVLASMLSEFTIPCNRDSHNSVFCESCQLGKHVRLPFSSSSSCSTYPFELIHCDLWTSPIASVSGFKYYLVILDDFTHFVWTFPLRNKSEVHSLFLNFQRYVSVHFFLPIRFIQCDNGREFDNIKNRTFFLQHGILLRFSCPYTSPQNGKAERSLRTLNDIVRTLLIQSSMPPKFWAEALHMATFLLNIRPSKTKPNTTPYYSLFLSHPDYSAVRVFGCLCFPNAYATSANKLSPRSIPCAFLGFSDEHKGYRCLDLHTGHVHVSRHVTFAEHIFPFSQRTTTPSNTPSSANTPSPRPFQLYTPLPAEHNLSPPPLTPTIANPNHTLTPPETSPTPPAPAPSPTPPAPTPTPPPSPAPTPPPSPTPSSDSSAAPDSPVPTLPPRAIPTAAPINDHRMRTRAKSGFHQPQDRLNLHTSVSLTSLPKNYKTALLDPNWAAAMQEEYNALLQNNTWQLVPRPPNTNIVSGKWIFRQKFHSDGSLSRYKARWVCRGFSQQQGIDYEETFSPVVKPSTIRTVLSVVVSSSWPIHQLDVKNAFLHGSLQETVYCQQPLGFENPSFPTHVCLLQKSLYGLKQAPRAWFQRFSSFIQTIGFTPSLSDTSLFVYHQTSDTAYLLLYVDDIILTASSQKFLDHIVSLLRSEFSMTDLGLLHHFLGIAVVRDSSSLFLSQRQYILDLLNRAGMLDCQSSRTPVDTSFKLSATGEPFSDPTLYRSLTGALQYLTITRPEISFAVQQACLYMHDPRVPHYNHVKRILRYLKGTLNHGLHLNNSSPNSLTAYSDADWAGCPDTRRSTSGFCVFLGNNLISWSSKRQVTVSRSSAEAEYRAVAHAVADTIWIRQLLSELHRPIEQATIVYCDNISAVYMTSNPVQHRRTKHIEIDIHFVREKVALGQVRVLHVPSTAQFADIFTKALPTKPFQDICFSLNVVEPAVDTAGGC